MFCIVGNCEIETYCNQCKIRLTFLTAVYWRLKQNFTLDFKHGYVQLFEDTFFLFKNNVRKKKSIGATS